MTQSLRTSRKTTDKEANEMASNDIEVLDPAATVENLKKITSGVALSRRHFMTGLGVAGVAAGTGLELGPVAHAQQPIPNGYQQVDILNYLLNIKYLTATFYSYLTQGADLPGTTYATLSSGAVYNTPSKVSFSTSQITDLFNEMYYDDLNQVIDLRNLIAGSLTLQTTPVVPRPTLSLGGQGNNTAAQTFTAAQAISQARMLEDVSVTAFTGALTYLSGANLALATQCLAISGMHASALRLLSIQTAAPYQRTQLTTTLQVGTTSGSASVLAIGTLSANILNGANILGTGIPANTTIVSQSSKVSATFGAIATNGSAILTSVTSVSQAAIGQPLTGTGIPTNTVITNVGVTTVTMSANATANSTATATGITVSGSNIINTVSSISSVVLGQTITGSGTGIPAGTTITATSSTTSGNTITMSVPATASSVVASLNGNLTAGSSVVTLAGADAAGTAGVITGQPITGTGIPAGTTVLGTGSSFITGLVTTGSKTISNVSNTTALVAGQPISGTGIPSGATISSFTANTITLSAAATANSTSTFLGSVTSGSANITGVASLSGVLVGQAISGTGIQSGATIASTIGSSAPFTVVMSKTASGNSSSTFTGLITSGSTSITGVSSLANVVPGLALSGTGIPAGTTVVSTSGVSTIVMSNAATLTSSFTVFGVVTAGSTTITSALSLTDVTTGQTISGAGIPAGTTVVSSTANNIVISNFPTASSSSTETVFTTTGNVTTGSANITAVASLTGVTPGQLIGGTGIPSGAIVVSASGTTIVMSANATATTAASTVTPTGIVTSGSTSITSVSSLTGISTGQLISGTGIPAGTTVTSISGASTIIISSAATASSITAETLTINSTGTITFTQIGEPLTITATETVTITGVPETVTFTAIETLTVPPYTITLSQPATASGTNVPLSTPAIVTLTFPTTETITTGQSIITISQPATATASSTASVILTDPLDVAPADPGTAALAAAGPAPSPTLTPAANQAFFNTTGANNSSGTNPPGFAIARTFSQVLAALYANATPGIAKGGFYFVGVNGKINVV
jgi:hypothetical protein